MILIHRRRDWGRGHLGPWDPFGASAGMRIAARRERLSHEGRDEGSGGRRISSAASSSAKRNSGHAR